MKEKCIDILPDKDFDTIEKCPYCNKLLYKRHQIYCKFKKSKNNSTKDFGDFNYDRY